MVTLVILLAATVSAQAPQTKKQINFVSVAQAAAAPLDSYVFVRAKIISVLPPRPDSTQPYSLYISDASGKLRVVIFQDTWNAMASTDFIIPGSSVDVYGQAGEFKAVRQLAVMAPNHIRITPNTRIGGHMGQGGSSASGFVPITIGALNMTLVGQHVRVRGTVKEITPPPKDTYPTRVYIADQTGMVEVVYWSQVEEKIPANEKPKINEPCEVSGIVNEYRGKLQLRVDDPTWVSKNYQQRDAAEKAEREKESQTPPDDGFGVGT